MKVYLFHANAGYGHRKIAEIIQREFKERGFSDEDARLEDALDFTPGFFKHSYPWVYFNAVKHCPGLWGWNYEFLDRPFGSNMIRPIRTLGNGLVGGGVIDLVKKEKPDVIICAHFFSAQLLSRARKRGVIDSKIITVVTDFLPHSFWVNEGTDLYWVMSDEGVRDLERRGVPSEKIMAGGIPVGRDFLPAGKKQEFRKKHELDAERFTVLFTSGSFGLGPTKEILREMEQFTDRVQAVVVCGNNKDLKSELDRTTFSYPVKVYGFVDFMPELMELADLLVAKSGGSTTCESLAKGLPMVVLRPIPGQETRNAAVLKERKASFFIVEPEQIIPILDSIFQYPHLLRERKEAIAELARPNAASDLVNHVLKMKDQ